MRVVTLAVLCGLAMPFAAPVVSPPPGPVAGELHKALTSNPADAQVAAVYRSRAYRPIWVRGRSLASEARAFVAVLETADDDGLEPDSYAPAGLARLLDAADRTGSPADLARADISLSRALGSYGSDLHTPRPAAEMAFTDPAVARPSYAPGAVVAFAARSPDLGAAVAEIRRMSPPYQQLRAILKAARVAEEPEERKRLILANLDRARALPADLGRRYLLVDAAAQMLWLYQDGQVLDSMPVVVGKRSEPTPSMAGLIRYAVLRPYWIVPPDLVRDTIAPRVLRQGVSYLMRQNMEALSDGSQDATVLDPAGIDWSAVAAGQLILRLRQRPGEQNMMGQIKFMFPNRLGVYLHDTPFKALFAGVRRAESSGCVRLADAPRLAQWLAPEAAGQLGEAGEPERRVDLPEPIPVYIVYFTVAPGHNGMRLRDDIYGRDAALLNQIDRRSAGTRSASDVVRIGGR